MEGFRKVVRSYGFLDNGCGLTVPTGELFSYFRIWKHPVEEFSGMITSLKSKIVFGHKGSP